MEKISIKPKAMEVINAYLNLSINKITTQTPYYINQHRRKDLRVMVGKGLPSELEMEALIWSKVKGFTFEGKSSKEVKKFLIDLGIGIDCSGFVLHILNEVFKAEFKKSIWGRLKIKERSLWARIRYFLRPVENISADTLTSELNTEIVDINNVKPMDLIRSKGRRVGTDHVMIVTEVYKNDNNEVILIRYAHSTPYYGDKAGVKFGEIKINDPGKPLIEQDWIEFDENGINYTFEGFKNNNEDNGLRRLKINI